MLALVAAALVANPAAARQTPASWRVADTPDVSIGLDDGPPEYLFGKVVSVAMDADGRYFVADLGDKRVAVFDARGSFIRDIGREGKGPGEFLSISSISLQEDGSLVVLDPRGPRVLHFDTDGRSLSTRTVAAGGFRSLSLLMENRIVAIGSKHPGTAGDAGSVMADTLQVSLLDRDGKEVVQVGEVAQAQRIVLSHRGLILFEPFPFSPYAAFHASSAFLVYGFGSEQGFTLVDTAGGRTWIRVDLPQKAVTRSDIAALSEWMRGTEDEETKGRTDRYLGMVSMPRHMPIYSDLKVDAEGNVWVRRYNPPWDAANDWVVVDRTGRQLASVSVPERFLPMQILPHAVVGVVTEPNGVQRVQRRRIDRG